LGNSSLSMWFSILSTFFSKKNHTITNSIKKATFSKSLATSR
jgi:hypothetical protein